MPRLGSGLWHQGAGLDEAGLDEAGIEVGRIEYLSSQPWPFPNLLMIGCRGEALSETITVNPTELE